MRQGAANFVSEVCSSIAACLYAVRTTFLSTLKARANACHETPESRKDLTSAESALFSRRRPLSLRSLSLLLSDGVPRNKCFGFVHSGLSHLWQTNIPRGISPKWSIQDTRLAGAFSCMPPRRIMPYPNGCFAPIHFQHPSCLMTFSQKRSANGLAFLMFESGNVAMTTL